MTSDGTDRGRSGVKATGAGGLGLGVPGNPVRITLELARSAALRASAQESLRWKRAFRHLPDVVSLAPWIGTLGTVLGISNSFPGLHGSLAEAWARWSRSLSEALIPAAGSVAIAIFAYHVHRYSLGRTERLVSEMEAIADAFAASPGARDRGSTTANNHSHRTRDKSR